MATIEELMRQLGSMSYNAPSSYKGYTSGYSPVDRSIPEPINTWNITPEDFNVGKPKKNKKVDLKPDFWAMLSGTLGQPSGILTDFVYNQAKAWSNVGSKKNDTGLGKELFDALIGDSLGGTLVKGIGAGAKKQWKNWNDGKVTWGDVPLVGVLNGMDEHWKRGSDIMELAGVDNRWGKVGGGIALDVALDPLTYLTGGLSAAGKLGKAEELAKIAKHSKDLGIVQKARNVEEFKDVLIPALQAKYAKYPNLADRMVERKFNNIIDDIQAARTKAFNDNINSWGFSVPFSNKLTTTVGTYGAKNPLYRSEATLGSDYAHIADNLLEEFGATGEKRAEVLQKMFGKTDTTQLTKSELEALADGLAEARKLQREFNSTRRLMPQVDIAEVKVMPRKGTQVPANPNFKENMNQLRLGGVVEEFDDAPRYIRDVQTSMGNSNIGKGVEDFVERQNVMFDGKTNMEHWLDRNNPFDARTLKTGDKFLDSMANHIADGNSQRIGETAKYTKDIQRISDYIRKHKITNTEMQHAIYHIEGKAPKNLGKDWQPSDKVKKLAGLINNVTKAVGDDDVAAGVLSQLRNNYFPHVINRTDDEMKAMLEFDQRHPELNGLNKGNKFDRSRKSFPTLADRDDYIQKLAKLISKETDPAAKVALEEQLKRVENLFDTDVVSALTRRVREGVRSRAMKAMQTKLSKFGMMVSDPTDISKTKGLKKLDPTEARKLGLGKGEHYMHEKVLEGMKRVDEIFTDQGMNKMVRHMAAISDMWRPLVTYYKPSHYVNNSIGNLFNNLAAGVNLNDYKKATKLLKSYRDGTISDEHLKIMNAAYKHNVISGGFLFDSKPTFSFDNPTAMERVAEKIGENRAIKKTRAFGEKIDDFFRMANFLNGIDKYGKVERGAAQVREYLFNYNELTNADRAMRVAVPFWNWTKRNIPLQAKLLLEQPKYAINVERFKDLFNEGEAGADWQKESGIKISDNRYTTIPSPTHDLEMLTDPVKFMASLNPALKMPIEMGTNRNIFTGNPISYGSNELQGEDLLPYLMSQSGIGKNAYDLGTGDKDLIETLMGLVKPTSKINHNKDGVD